MPLYIYQHPVTEETVEVFQGMNDEHIYSDSNGISWTRIFSKPQAAMDTRISANSSEDFVKKTRGKNYSLGQLWDKSAELSEKRGGNSGDDEVRAKAENAYKQKTGKRHPHAKTKSKFEI